MPLLHVRLCGQTSWIAFVYSMIVRVCFLFSCAGCAGLGGPAVGLLAARTTGAQRRVPFLQLEVCCHNRVSGRTLFPNGQSPLLAYDFNVMQ